MLLSYHLWRQANESCNVALALLIEQNLSSHAVPWTIVWYTRSSETVEQPEAAALLV